MEQPNQQLQIADMQQMLGQWKVEHNSNGYDPQPILTRMAELIEQQTQIFLKMIRDPFDDRHPYRMDPRSGLGIVLQLLFHTEVFVTKLVGDYMRDTYWSRQNMGVAGDHRSFELNVAACRLLLDIMPGLDTSAVFQEETESQLHRLISWAEHSAEPLQSYATGLLASAMEVSEIAAKFRQQNSRLVPLMLKRLHTLEVEQVGSKKEANLNNQRPFAHLGMHTTPPSSPGKPQDGEPAAKKRALTEKHNLSPRGLTSAPAPLSVPLSVAPDTVPTSSLTAARRPARFMPLSTHLSRTPPEDVAPPLVSPLAKPSSLPISPRLKGDHSPPFHRLGTASQSTNFVGVETVTEIVVTPVPPPPRAVPVPTASTGSRVMLSMTNNCSNSFSAVWESLMIGCFKMHPVTLATKQILILRYLTPVGEYQEFVSHVFEHNALELILIYTNLTKSCNARLTFEALKYLGALLCHKKFSFEFINIQCMQHLMNVHRPGIASCGVAMCLYHMSYCEDTMERICLLPCYIIHKVVRYALCLLESSHDSSRCHAVMFFTLALPFQVILEEFDNQDGLRKVYNVVATLELLSADVHQQSLNEDERCAARQLIRHAFMCFKRYFETHLTIHAEQLRRDCMREQPVLEGGQQQPPPLTAPPYKPVRTSPEQVQENVETLMQLLSIGAHWSPVDNFLSLSGIALLLKVIAYAYEWNYFGRAETVRSALDTLAVCVVIPKTQLQLCDTVEIPLGMKLVVGAAEGEIVADADVQRSALNVIGNCVCAPVHRMGVMSRIVVGSAKKKTMMRNSEATIARMWDTVRTNNGIMVLLQLMTVKARLTDADSIRMLACRALAGLARSETVRQIIGKLPLVTDGQLQMLMRDPILQDRKQEHVLFQKYAVLLLERVSGKPGCNKLEASLANIHRANVVSQTLIQYNKQQLFQLIHQHLMNKNLTASANQLFQEAGLPEPPPTCQSSARPTPVSAFPSSVSHRTNIPPPPSSSRTQVLPGSSTLHLCSPAATSSTRQVAQTLVGSKDSSGNVSPIKLNLSSGRQGGDSPLLRQEQTQSIRVLQKQTNYENTNYELAGQVSPNATNGICDNTVSLDAIIREYLKNQHALCKNPVATCPQFNLFKPHKCPDPHDRCGVATNFAVRTSLQQHGSLDSARLDRRLVHSRFCPIKSFRLETNAFFSCVVFDPQEPRLMMGTLEGQMKLFNLHNGAEDGTFQCHESNVYRLEPSRDRRLLLTSSTWRRPLSALFTLDRFFQMQYEFDDEEYVEFSKVTQNRIIGTKDEVASIYDVETGRKLATLRPDLSNHYSKNRATFSPCDELVLSDGVLWDVSADKAIHKFDKLNQRLSGVFHPNGLEVISNTEVWDLRTFHLLRTVPALDQCDLRFTPAGDVIYCFSMEAESDEDSSFESSFKTLDARDYSSIATMDVKRNIHDLAVNSSGTQVAVIENQGTFQNVQESSVRLYDVGRRRNDEDEAEEEDDEDQLDGSNDDGSSSSSSSGDDDDDPDA